MTTMNQYQQEIERLERKNRLFAEIQRHIGGHRAIGMAELYEIVFQRPWKHRINDTRRLRTYITELRREGAPICSTSTAEGGGYYLGQTTEEINNYLHRREHKALKILVLNARMKKISLPDYLGQMQMRLGTGHEG